MYITFNGKAVFGVLFQPSVFRIVDSTLKRCPPQSITGVNVVSRSSNRSHLRQKCIYFTAERLFNYLKHVLSTGQFTGYKDENKLK